MAWFGKKEEKQGAPTTATKPAVFTSDALEGRPTRFEIISAARDKTFQKSGFGMDDLKDQFVNAGLGVPEAQISWYSNQSFIGYQMCAMLSQHWLIEKACWTPAKDAVRKGWELTNNDGADLPPELIQRIKTQDIKAGIRRNAIEFAAMSRVFGIRVALFIVDHENSEEYYANPFNIDSVAPGSYRGISQIDPYWMSPMLDGEASSNPASKRFYEPTWWIINGRKVHYSHLVISVPCPVADILKPTYMYGGVSIPQKIYERVYAADRTANEAPQLAMTKRMDIYHMDLAKALANQGSFEAQIAWWRSNMDNYGVKVIGQDETMERFDTSLTDLDVVIMTQYQLVAAAANMPATKLLGTTPKGFNATGEYEEASYHEELETIQSLITPLLDRHYILSAKSLGLDATITPRWNELDALTAKEQAEINKLKAEAGSVLVQSGAIDGMDERDRISADPSSGYSGLAQPIEPEPIGDSGSGDRPTYRQP